MRLLEVEAITEAVIRLEMPDSILTVIKNPTQQQTTNLLTRSDQDILRGIVDHEDNLYIWDAAKATHEDVNEHIGVGMKYRLTLYASMVTTDVRCHPLSGRTADHSKRRMRSDAPRLTPES